MNTIINITLINNVTKKTVPTTTDTTVRDFLEANQFEYARRGVLVDGVPLGVGDLDKSFAELGVTGNAYVTSVAKADNA